MKRKYNREKTYKVPDEERPYVELLALVKMCQLIHNCYTCDSNIRGEGIAYQSFDYNKKGEIIGESGIFYGFNCPRKDTECYRFWDAKVLTRQPIPKSKAEELFTELTAIILGAIHKKLKEG